MGHKKQDIMDQILTNFNAASLDSKRLIINSILFN